MEECAELSRRYARLRSCFVADKGDKINLRGTILFAPARPADSMGKLFTLLPEDKIFERGDVIT